MAHCSPPGYHIPNGQIFRRLLALNHPVPVLNFPCRVIPPADFRALSMVPSHPLMRIPLITGESHFMRNDPKPNQSYIGLIAMAILSSKDKKLVLSDIYSWITDNYEYFRARGPGWKNSIRHNLSLNDCFVKSGRGENGKGHYWSIHPANLDDFLKGDFRRRRAQQQVKRHMRLNRELSPLSISDKEAHEHFSPASSSESVEEDNNSETISPNTQLRVERRAFDIETLLSTEHKRRETNTLLQT